MKAKIIDVKIPNKDPYRVILGAGLLERVGAEAKRCVKSGNAFIVSNSTVYDICGTHVKRSLTRAGFKVKKGLIGDGEKYKSIKTFDTLHETIASEYGGESDFFIVAVGGGVVEDLAGFIASTYGRSGVPYIQVPTTLLALVDCSVGGKTGINLKFGKNLVGAFHQPVSVISDIETLKSLPQGELLSGFAEVLKYAIGFDAPMFSRIEKEYDSLINLGNLELLSQIMKKCIEIKVSIVEKDETDEKGIRSLLNLGHTFGHALEAATKYRKFRHGEAIAFGMVCASEISFKLGCLTDEEFERIENLIRVCGLPTRFNGCDVDDLMVYMKRDKKFKRGVRRYILPVGIGECKVFENIDQALIKRVLKKRQNSSRIISFSTYKSRENKTAVTV